MTQQLELDFFWPLTEQLCLDLDYADVYKPKFNNILSTGSTSGYFTTMSGRTTNSYTINIDQLKFTTSKKPSIWQSILYAIMGIKLDNK